MVIDTRQFIRRWNSGSVKQNPDARARRGRVSEGIRKQLRLQAARSLMLNSGLDARAAPLLRSATKVQRNQPRIQPILRGQPPIRDIPALHVRRIGFRADGRPAKRLNLEECVPIQPYGLVCDRGNRVFA
jgi:hypothetical protein